MFNEDVASIEGENFLTKARARFRQQGALFSFALSSSVRTRGGFGGQPPPSLTIGKDILFFWNDPPFFKQTLPTLLSCFSVYAIQLAYITSGNLHCDAIIQIF